MSRLGSLHEVSLEACLLADDWRKILGRNIARLADQVPEKSRKGLADYLGVSLPMVSRWSKGKAVPLKYFDRICDYFDCEPKALFDTDGELPASKQKRKVTLEEAIDVVNRHSPEIEIRFRRRG